MANPFQYTGREFAELVSWGGLYYFRARYYDPSVGRFLTKDPAGLIDGPNLYAYVGNNPVSQTDPSGTTHAWWSWLCTAAMVVICALGIFVGYTLATMIWLGMCIGITGFWLAFLCGIVGGLLYGARSILTYACIIGYPRYSFC